MKITTSKSLENITISMFLLFIIIGMICATIMMIVSLIMKKQGLCIN